MPGIFCEAERQLLAVYVGMITLSMWLFEQIGDVFFFHARPSDKSLTICSPYLGPRFLGIPICIIGVLSLLRR